jgi:hypothetical protein
VVFFQVSGKMTLRTMEWTPSQPRTKCVWHLVPSSKSTLTSSFEKSIEVTRLEYYKVSTRKHGS